MNVLRRFVAQAACRVFLSTEEGGLVLKYSSYLKMHTQYLMCSLTNQYRKVCELKFEIPEIPPTISME